MSVPVFKLGFPGPGQSAEKNISHWSVSGLKFPGFSHSGGSSPLHKSVSGSYSPSSQETGKIPSH